MQMSEQVDPPSPRTSPPSKSHGSRHGASTTRDRHPLGKVHLDGAGLPLPDQVEEIGVASHSLHENLASEQRGGCHIHVPLGTREYEWPRAQCLSPPRATLYVRDVPFGLSMVLTVTSGLVDLWVNPPGCPGWPGGRGWTLEENMASGSPSQGSPPRG